MKLSAILYENSPLLVISPKVRWTRDTKTLILSFSYYYSNGTVWQTQLKENASHQVCGSWRWVSFDIGLILLDSS
jgi:hypothetical protein